MERKPLEIGQEVIIGAGHSLTKGVIKEINNLYIVADCSFGAYIAFTTDVFALDERDRLRAYLDSQISLLNDQFDISFKEGLFHE